MRDIHRSVRRFERRSRTDGGDCRLTCRVPELETRLEDWLRTTHDLAAIDVAIDGRGRATITAAPPINDLATDVPSGWRAVSVQTLVPAGIGSGDEVLVSTATTTIRGVVLRVAVDEAVPHEDRPATASDLEETVLIAVPTPQTSVLLEADSVRLVVTRSRCVTSSTRFRCSNEAVRRFDGRRSQHPFGMSLSTMLSMSTRSQFDRWTMTPVLHSEHGRSNRLPIYSRSVTMRFVGTDLTALDSIDRKQSAPEVSY